MTLYQDLRRLAQEAKEAHGDHIPWTGKDVGCKEYIAALAPDVVLELLEAGHRFESPHDCFVANCKALGPQLDACLMRERELTETALEVVRVGLLWSGRPDYEGAQVSLVVAIMALREALGVPAE